MKSFLMKPLAILSIAFTLFSFTKPAGGEGFEVFLNNNVILQCFGSQVNSPQTIQLAQGSVTDEITIKYYHCGKTGKNRVLTVKDGQDKTLKEFRFADASSASSGMCCKVKDIVSLRKGNSSVMKLYYSSSELPGGRLLASIVTGVQQHR